MGKFRWQLLPAALFLLILPLNHTIALRFLCLFLAAAVALRCFLKPGAPPLPLKLTLALWAGIGILSLTWSLDPMFSLNELKTEIGYGLIAFFTFYNLTTTETEWKLWLNILMLSLGITLTLALISKWHFGLESADWDLLHGVGTYSTYLITILPILLLTTSETPIKKFPKNIIWLLVPFFLLVGFITLNRALWLSTTIIASIFFYLQWARKNPSQKWKASIGVIGIFLVGIALFISFIKYKYYNETNISIIDLVIHSFKTDDRPEIWRFWINLIEQKPWTGVGFGRDLAQVTYHDILPPQAAVTHSYAHAHNLFLDYGLQMGIGGIVILILLFLSIVKEFWSLYKSEDKKTSTIGICGIVLVVGFVSKNLTDDFFWRGNALFFWSLVGILLGYGKSRFTYWHIKHTTSHLSNPTNIPKSFLIIRRDNIGDLVCTTPLIRALRQHYPAATICSLVNSYTAPVLNNNPDVDAVFAYTKAKHRPPRTNTVKVYWDRLRLFVQLRIIHFDYAILAAPRFQPRLLRLARLAGAQRIVGFTDSGTKPNNSYIDIGIPYMTNPQLHETEDVFRLLEPLGISGTPPKAKIIADEKEVLHILQDLAKITDPNSTPIIGVHISARKISQRWPEDNFVIFIKELRNNYQASFILFWAPGDAANPLHPGDDAKAKQIMAELAGIPVLAHATDQLTQLIAGLSLCDMVICSDGGAMHLAAGLGKPILCFFGKSDPVRWHPWRVPYVVLQPPSLEAKDISVETALEGARKLLTLTQQAR